MHDRRPIIVLASLLAICLSALALVSVPIALAAAAGLAMATAIFFKPFFGLLVYVSLLFLKPQRFIPALVKMRIMLVLAIIIIVVYTIHRIVRKERIVFASSRQDILMLILLAIVPLSNIVNTRLVASWEAFNEFMTVFILFFIITGIARDFSRFRTVCWTLVACTLALALNGLLQRFRGMDLIGFEPVAGRVRGAGIFTDPNEFALLINSFLPFVLINLFEKGMSGAKKLLLAIAACIMISVVYYTNSRGGFIALLSIVAFFSYRRWGAAKGIALSAVVILVAVLLAPSRTAELSLRESSATGRVNAWITGLTLLRSHPLLGVGFGNFTIFNRLDAHSAFVKCFAELGLIGYYFWLALIYACIADLRWTERHSADPVRAKYARMLVMSFLAFLVSSFFLTQTYSPILYILAALATIAARVLPAPPLGRAFLLPKEIVRIALILVGSVAFIRVLSFVYY